MHHSNNLHCSNCLTLDLFKKNMGQDVLGEDEDPNHYIANIIIMCKIFSTYHLFYSSYTEVTTINTHHNSLSSFHLIV